MRLWENLAVGAFLGAALGLIGAGVLVFSVKMEYSDISNIPIEYKSIDPSDEGYYAIGQDGSIYEISQSTWANLQAPVIAETK